MDHYERGLINMIAGSRADTASTEDPQLTYFQPLSPGSSREYGNTGTCCGGTGMESHTKYQETVYLRSADGSTLWVNLYVPSTLDWTEKGFSLKQETLFPRGDRASFTITKGGTIDIKLRVPGWIRNGYFVTINGKAQSTESADPSTYLTLSRTWKAGDVIQVRVPFGIRTERALDRPDTQSIFWGPVLLQTVGKPVGGPFWNVSLYRYLKRDGDYTKAAIKQTGKTPAGDPLFTTKSASNTSTLNVRPYYISDSQPVSSYFRRVEPSVVFGSIDTGVPNRERNDGLPKYDVPVMGVTTPGTDGPTFLDLVWDAAPFATHATFVQKVTSTADSFAGAGILSTQERDIIIAKAKLAEHELNP